MKKRSLGILTIVLTGLLFLCVGVLTAADVPDNVTNRPVVVNNQNV